MHQWTFLRPAPLLIAAALLSACGEEEITPDPAAIDAHLNKIEVDEEREKARLIEAARDREDMREDEMNAREENYAQTPD
jgi:hypothetical protein